MFNQVMTVDEAARRWGITPGGVRKAIEGGRLQATRSDGTWLIGRNKMSPILMITLSMSHKSSKRASATKCRQIRAIHGMILNTGIR